MPTQNRTEPVTCVVLPPNTLTDRVAENQFTVNKQYCMKDVKTKASTEERREFWVRQWEKMHPNTLKSLEEGQDNNSPQGQDRRRFMWKRSSDTWWEEIQKGKSPMEVWEAQIEEMEKNGKSRIYGHDIFPNDEVKEKWKSAKAEGKTDEFWYNYWTDLEKEYPPLSRRFGHPKEFQDKWQALRTEGKSPEEIWQEIGKNHWKMGRWAHHHHRRCPFSERNCWQQKFTTRPRELDESDIYQQFDF